MRSLARRVFREMRLAVRFGEEDAKLLRLSGEILAGQEEAILEAWVRLVREQPSLRASFPGDLDELLARYGASARQWLRDTAAAPYGEAWLARQLAVGRRQRPLTDTPLRYLLPLAAPLVLTLRPFLDGRGLPTAEVDRMQEAWLKAVLLQVALWSYPDLISGDAALMLSRPRPALRRGAS